MSIGHISKKIGAINEHYMHAAFMGFGMSIVTCITALAHKKLYSQTVALLLMTKHMVPGLINRDESYPVLELCLVRVKG